MCGDGHALKIDHFRNRRTQSLLMFFRKCYSFAVTIGIIITQHSLIVMFLTSMCVIVTNLSVLDVNA